MFDRRRASCEELWPAMEEVAVGRRDSLSKEDLAAVIEHLRECDSCRAEFDMISRLRSFYREVDQAAERLTPEFLEAGERRLMAAIEAKKAAEAVNSGSDVHSRHSRLSLHTMLANLAACGIILLAVFAIAAIRYRVVSADQAAADSPPTVELHVDALEPPDVFCPVTPGELLANAQRFYRAGDYFSAARDCAALLGRDLDEQQTVELHCLINDLAAAVAPRPQPDDDQDTCDNIDLDRLEVTRERVAHLLSQIEVQQ